jgi:hypothetical protein
MPAPFRPVFGSVVAFFIVACSDSSQSVTPTPDPQDTGTQPTATSAADAGAPVDSGPALDAGASPSNGGEPIDATSDDATVHDADANDAAAAARPDVPAAATEKAGGALGRVNINLVTGDAPYATIDGRVYAAPKPNFNETWEPTATEGPCQLVERRRVECSEACVAPASCAEGGLCLAEPAISDLGRLRAWGVETKGTQPFIELEQLPTGTYVLLRDSLQFPPFEAGDEVVFEASGGSVGDAFVVGVTAIEGLELTSTDAVPFEPDSPVTLTWIPGSVDAATMLVTVDISFHGGNFGQIRCQTEDSGQLTISAEMVTRLIDLGVAGFPHVELLRRSQAFVNQGGNHIEFNVVSSKFQLLSVPGVRSCTDDDQCEEGETCQASMCR